jgi:ABC-2 type transport system permease protein
MRLRTLQGGPAIQMPIFLALFLAPVYVPVDLLAGWVHAVATVNPVTAILNAGRDLISGSAGEIALAFAIVLALIGGFTAWALRGLRNAEAAGS